MTTDKLRVAELEDLKKDLKLDISELTAEIMGRVGANSLIISQAYRELEQARDRLERVEEELLQISWEKP